jgi:hypothetical protein
MNYILLAIAILQALSACLNALMDTLSNNAHFAASKYSKAPYNQIYWDMDKAWEFRELHPPITWFGKLWATFVVNDAWHDAKSAMLACRNLQICLLFSLFLPFWIVVIIAVALGLIWGLVFQFFYTRYL